MGQSSSKVQEHAAQNPESTSGTREFGAAGAHDESNTTPTASTSQHSRRQSLRRKVVNIVKSGSLREKATAATTRATETGDKRKSWRKSRRFSKSPAESYPTVVEAVEEQPPSSPEASFSRLPSTPSIPSYDKGKSREEEGAPGLELVESNDDSTSGERPSTPYPATALEAQQKLTLQRLEELDPDIQPALDESGARGAEISEELELEPPIQAENVPQPTPAPIPSAPPINQESRSNPPAAATRQFPPPGTLVVVQGIVHTTDVSRPSGPGFYTPGYSPQMGAGSEGSSSRARSPLGAFRRAREPPTSFTSSSSPSSWPSSSFANPPEISLSAARTDGSSFGHQESVGETSASASAGEMRAGPDSASSSSSSDPPPPFTEATASSNSESTPSRNAPNSQRSNSSAISPGSIDVLGTLLSVAAAATAASLLTGSSEPILSSGLAPPNSSTTTSGAASGRAAGTSLNNNSNNTNGAMDDYGSASGAAGSESNATEGYAQAHNHNHHHHNASADNYAASRAERMRQAWSTIRERLGLRPNPPASQPSLGSNGAPQTTAGGSAGGANGTGANEATGGVSPITDTRELMLAEMARAFNIGLGLNGLGGTGPTANGGAGEGGSSHLEGQSAQEGQQQHDGPSGSGEQAEGLERSGVLPPEGSFDRFLVDLQADLRVALTRDDEQVGDDEEGRGAAAAAVPPSPPPAVPVAIATTGGESASVQVRLSSTREEEEVDESDTHMAALMDLLAARPQSDEGVEFPRSTRLNAGATSQTSSSSSSPAAPPPIPALFTAESAEGSAAPAEGSTPTPAFSSTTTNTGSGAGRMDASGRINWWRLYRFPAITSPRTYASMTTALPGSPTTTSPLSRDFPSTVSLTEDFEEGDLDGMGEGRPQRAYVVDDLTRTRTRVRRGNAAAGAGAASTSAASNLDGASPASASGSGASGSGASVPQPQTFLPSLLPPPSGQTVVPVIVVGLQSVNAGMGWQGDLTGGVNHTHTHTHTHAHAHPHVHPHTFAQTQPQPYQAHNHNHNTRRSTGDEQDEIFAALEEERLRSEYEREEEEEEEDDLDDHMYAQSTRAIAAAIRERERVRLQRLAREWAESSRGEGGAEQGEGAGEGSAAAGGSGERRDDSWFQRRTSNALSNLRAAAHAEERMGARRRMGRGASASGAGGRASAGVNAGPGVSANASANASASASASAAENAAGTGSVGGGTNPLGTSGSRTFLIYVIGGYYPPDHSIVTGGPETFESFEALLELAEMLGHVKPPTVTKEEIDKSGLETIKPAMLSAYEAKGKIASSCTERCLICLDDYAPEDDVRVMTCRHAFHQVCVDKWLQTGRNNCPACRSTGVAEA